LRIKGLKIPLLQIFHFSYPPNNHLKEAVDEFERNPVTRIA